MTYENCAKCPDCGYTAVIVQADGIKYCLHCGWDNEGENRVAELVNEKQDGGA